VKPSKQPIYTRRPSKEKRTVHRYIHKTQQGKHRKKLRTSNITDLQKKNELDLNNQPDYQIYKKMNQIYKNMNQIYKKKKKKPDLQKMIIL
jgi:hypothetical protein